MSDIGLVHGLGGTADTMAALARALDALGHTTHLVTLPGHGTVPEDLLRFGWADWLAAVPRAEVLVGQSLGASLALAAAATRPDVRAVVAINPVTVDLDALEGLEWRRDRGLDWMPGAPLSEGEVGYDRLPIAALIEMVAGVSAVDLAAVTAPVLLVTGALDDTVDPPSLDALIEHVTGPVTRLRLPNSGHVASLGPDRDRLVEAICEFG